jgi:alpha-2-macroglobulin
VFFDLAEGNTFTSRIQLNAAYPGKYYLPTVKCEAMYDNSVYARKGGDWVVVSEEVVY